MHITEEQVMTAYMAYEDALVANYEHGTSETYNTLQRTKRAFNKLDKAYHEQEKV